MELSSRIDNPNFLSKELLFLYETVFLLLSFIFSLILNIEFEKWPHFSSSKYRFHKILYCGSGYAKNLMEIPFNSR